MLYNIKINFKKSFFFFLIFAPDCNQKIKLFLTLKFKKNDKRKSFKFR